MNLTYSLTQRPTLSDCDSVTFLNTESRADVCSEVLVSLFITGVFGDKVKIFAADDDRTVHLGRYNCPGEDTATDRD
jgi:hypothetical protein